MPGMPDYPANLDNTGIPPNPPEPDIADRLTLTIAHKVINGHKGTNHPTPGNPPKSDTNPAIEHLFECPGNDNHVHLGGGEAMTHPLPTHPPSL